MTCFGLGMMNLMQGAVIAHPHGPFDYSVNHNTVVFPLNNTDIQCDHHRSGFLCGHCKQGYSLLLGFFLNASNVSAAILLGLFFLQ